MDHPQGILRTGDRATVQFEFISQPEFVKEGMKLLFREGKTKVRLHSHCSPAVSAQITLTQSFFYFVGSWSNNTDTMRRPVFDSCAETQVAANWD